MSFIAGKPKSKGTPNTAFSSAAIDEFEQRGTSLASQPAGVTAFAPTPGSGRDVAPAAGQARVDKLISIFGARQQEIVQRKRAPGRTLLGGHVQGQRI